MINFSKKVLKNGLKIIVHEDLQSPLCAVNVLYNVGSKDENPKKTGYAHLFEHLMFGGSINAPDFDIPLQMAGGDNNAFTNADITNYYDVLPSTNIETALWLEADRMRGLVIDANALEIQRKVVLEEFAETCMNPPFGMKWHHINQMAYDQHHYQWPTIGKDPSHIAHAQIQDIEAFYNSWYQPNNAILCIAGGVSENKAFDLAEKWFQDIDSHQLPERIHIVESPQTKKKFQIAEKTTPFDMLTLAFKCCGRHDDKFYQTDLLTDILSGGRTARFFKSLVDKKQIFSSLDAYITGTIDPGLIIIEGRPRPEYSLSQAEEYLWIELEELKKNGITDYELLTQKNRVIQHIKFSEINILNKAINLSFFEALGDIHKINSEFQDYSFVSTQDIQKIANEFLIPENCSALYFKSNHEQN